MSLLVPIVVLAVIPSQAAKDEISSLANSHPDYLELRSSELGESFAVNDLTLRALAKTKSSIFGFGLI